MADLRRENHRMGTFYTRKHFLEDEDMLTRHRKQQHKGAHPEAICGQPAYDDMDAGNI